MWRLKYLIIGMIFPALVGLGIYVAAPRLSDKLKDTIRDGASSDVQEIFVRETPSRVHPGQIVITDNQLAAIVNDPQNRDEDWHRTGMDVTIQNGAVKLVTNQGSSSEATIYSVVPEIVNGQLVLTQRQGILQVFKTAQDAISDEIENQANALFANSAVVPVSISAEDGRLVIVTQTKGTSAAGGTSPTATAAANAAPTATENSIVDGIFGVKPTATP